jgi:ribose transport system substrate-binding protein
MHLPPHRSLLALLGLIAAVALSACGSSSSPTPSGSPPSTAPAAGGSGKPLTFFEERVAALYKGTFTSPPTTSPKPQTGKEVWIISYGLSSSSGAEIAAGMQEAGKAIGWKVKVVDGKFDSNAESTGIRNAIAAEADAIALYAIDCPPIQAALQQAKKAKVPVFGIESNDCGEIKPGAPNLFAADNGDYSSAPYGGTAPYGNGWIQGYAKAAADSLIVHGKGKAKVIDMKETDSEATLREDQGFLEEMKLCGGCEVVQTVPFTGADFGPALQQKTAQALLKHPEATGVFGVYDGPVISGIAAAVRESGRKGKLWVTGGEGDLPNVDLVRRNQGQNAGVILPVQWEAYSAIDAMNRVFNNAKPVPNGIGLGLWDLAHNMPPKGKPVASPVDFKPIYRKAWGVG